MVMAYSNRRGRRPFELASKAGHSRVIKDPAVGRYLAECQPASRSPSLMNLKSRIYPVDPSNQNQIDHVVATDSGSTTPITLPGTSAKLSVVQFGVVAIGMQDLAGLRDQEFVSSQALGRLKRHRRHTLILPTSDIIYQKKADLVDSLRLTIYEFFSRNNLLDTWCWLIWQRYRQPRHSLRPQIRECPKHPFLPINFRPGASIKTCPKPGCGRAVYITDVFNWQPLAQSGELSDEFIRGLIQLIEVMFLARSIKQQLDGNYPIHRTLFILDGQLMIKDPSRPQWSSQDRLTRMFRHFSQYLVDNHGLNLVAVEKSGVFVNYADKIASPDYSLLEPGYYLLLNNQIVYGDILPQRNGPRKPYGHYSHYGSKLIFRANHGCVYAITTPPWLKDPRPDQFPNLDAILLAIQQLRCDLYHNALLPVVLANKTVSLSFKPGKDILQKFLASNIVPEIKEAEGQLVLSPRLAVKV